MLGTASQDIFFSRHRRGMSKQPIDRPGVIAVRPTDSRPRVRLTGPGAVVSCLPQLIGFPPVESLVLVGLTPGRAGRREVGLTLRVDVDDVLVAPGNAPCHPARLAEALRRNRCTGAFVIIVSDRTAPPFQGAPADDFGWHLLDQVTPALEASGLEVVDSVLLSDGRWWSYQCSQPTCCPKEGTLVSRADADLLTAERAWAGDPTEVLAGREAIVAKVAPSAGPEATELAALLSVSKGTRSPGDPQEALELIADLIDRFGLGRPAAVRGEPAGEPAVAPETWARLLVALTDVLVRDACLAPWKGDVGAAALSLWCAATRIAPPGLVAAPATLAALVAHARGEGALAGESVIRALADDPHYRLATYAAQALGGGLAPSIVRRALVESTGTLRARGEPALDRQGKVVLPRVRP